MSKFVRFPHTPRAVVLYTAHASFSLKSRRNAAYLGAYRAVRRETLDARCAQYSTVHCSLWPVEPQGPTGIDYDRTSRASVLLVQRYQGPLPWRKQL